MKYVGLLILLVFIPLFKGLLSSGRVGRKTIGFLMGFIPFIVQSTHIVIAPISWRYWPGYVKGLEFSLIDSLVLAVLLSSSRHAVRARAFHMVPFGLLIAFALVSAVHATAPTAAAFVAWQMLRVSLVYVAAIRIASDQDGIRSLIAGMVLGLSCNAVWAAIQHVRGIYQAPGLFDHQNSLGMAAHFVALPAAALFVADNRARWALFAIAAAGGVAIFGASRATVGLEAAGVSLLILTIAVLWPSPRGFALLAVGCLGIAVMSPLAMKALAPRFSQVEATNYDEREAFKQASYAMLHDHPFGIGANHYVLVANVDGYSARANVAWTTASRAANVHNSYLLTAAEMGWAALIPFVWLTILSALNGIFWSFRSRDRKLSIMLLGSCAAQLVVAVHCLFEWVFVTYVIQVIFCINLGIIGGLIGQIRARKAMGAGRRDAIPEPASRSSVGAYACSP